VKNSTNYLHRVRTENLAPASCRALIPTTALFLGPSHTHSSSNIQRSTGKIAPNTISSYQQKLWILVTPREKTKRVMVHTSACANIVDSYLLRCSAEHGLHMRIHKVTDMDVVTYTCAITCVVISPTHLPHTKPPSELYAEKNLPVNGKKA
jgi:hypothetical protein